MQPRYDGGYLMARGYVFVRSFGASDLWYDPTMTSWDTETYKFWLYHPDIDTYNMKFDGMSDILALVESPDIILMTEDDLAILTATVVVLGEVDIT